MSKLGLVKVLVVLAVVCVALPQTGCASSKEKNRMKVLKAENADLVQRTGMLQGQFADAQSQSDMRGAELQQAQFELAEKQRLAEQAQANGASATARADALASQQDEALVVLEEHQRQQVVLVERLEHESEAKRQLERELMAERNRPRATAARAPNRLEVHSDQDSKEVVAFQRDLQRRLSSQGINAPVEIRTASDGQRRVAVVLPDAFKAGKATLAYNADAVTTVVRLGQLVQADYPNSTISIEGHTDSDPIRRSNWRSNEHLSEARAQHVAKLLKDTGIQGGRVEAIGRGARQPIEPGATKRAKSANRRVELFIDPRAR